MKYSFVRLHCVIHKNSLLLNQHNGDDAPQKKRQVDMTKPIVNFRNFANAPEKRIKDMKSKT